MESSSISRTNKWKKKASQSHRSPYLPILLITLLFTLLFFISYKHISNPLLPISTNSQSAPPNQCHKTLGDKFLLYAPHSGFSNQLSELKNAVLMAVILNRTLVVPPVLDHHAVALGSCPKFRVLSPNELRRSVWDHVIELIRSRRYLHFLPLFELLFV